MSQILFGIGEKGFGDRDMLDIDLGNFLYGSVVHCVDFCTRKGHQNWGVRSDYKLDPLCDHFFIEGENC